MWRWIRRLAALAALPALALGVYVRLAPSDPAVWHVDPVSVEERGARNSFLATPGGEGADMASPTFAASAAEVAAAFDSVARAAPRTRRLAGSPEIGWTTYVQRSLIMGYPDYVSVRVVELPDGRAALAVFSRSRFGSADMGVNEARVRRWLEAVDGLVD